MSVSKIVYEGYQKPVDPQTKPRGVRTLVKDGEVVKTSDQAEYARRKKIFDAAMSSIPKPAAVDKTRRRFSHDAKN